VWAMVRWEARQEAFSSSSSPSSPLLLKCLNVPVLGVQLDV